MVLFTPITTFRVAGWKFRFWFDPTPLGMITVTTGDCVVEVVLVVP